MGPHSMLGRDPELVAGKTVGREVLQRVWRFARPYRWMLLLFLGTIVFASLVEVAPPLLFRRLIDLLATNRDTIATKTFPSNAWHTINFLAVAAVALALGDAVLGVAQRWWSARIGEGVIFDLRVALFDHVERMPVAFFTRTQTGSLISRLNNDVIGAQQALTGTLGTVVSNVIGLTTTLIVMFALEWRLTLLSLVVLPAFIIPAKRVGRRLQKITREGMQVNASMNATMTERFNVAGALLVKLFGSYEAETKSFSDRAGRVRDIGVKSAMYGRVFFVAMGLVGAIGTALVYWLGARMVISGAISLGTIGAFAIYVTRIYMPITSLTNARIDLMTAFVSFDRVFEVLDTPHAIADRPGAVDLTEAHGRIEVDDVWFRYPSGSSVSIASLEGDGAAPLSEAPSDWILRGVSFTAEPGEMIALVGPSGAGKTTLSNLIPRLYDVTTGIVRIDGHDVRDLTLASLTRGIGVVTQDAHLFHDSIATNLRYAEPDATDEELVAACRSARIHDVIAGLSEGYDTVVGDRGYRMSGGEKQRLAIARVLLKDPAVVILDEATAHLDSETELLIQQALAEALAGRTSVVIAHRLSTVQAADQILVVDDGRIVERGTHDTLLGGGGLYEELYETQYQRQAPPPPGRDASAAQ
jgi:ATP-binding cassette subfamily B protein